MRDFIEYLRNEKHKAKNTLIAYEKDIADFEEFLSSRGVNSIDDTSDSDATSYFFSMKNQKKSRATINRKVSALRAYFEYMVERGERTSNPFARIKSEKTGDRKIDYLSIEEVERLIGCPDDSPKGIRDRALLEFMYGTGARVSEVVRLRFEDVNLRMDFVTLRDVNDESRLVPLGKYAKSALKRYFENAYEHLRGRKNKPEDCVFVNYRGEALTRQGIWRILRGYGEAIGAENRMTPQILRDSFAIHILQNGGDLRTLQELMGFDDMSVGISYLAAIEIHVKEVFNRTHPRA